MKYFHSVRRSAARGGLTLVTLLAILSTANSRLNGEDWAQFRGPNCSGISTNGKPLPVEFSATENVRWSETVGDGSGGAVVAAG